MWGPLLMYGLPALAGGAAAYKQSGGNLGSALLGAGLSAGGVKGLRMAGTALAGTPAVAGALGRASGGLTSASTNLAERAAAMSAGAAPGLAGAAARTGASGLSAGATGLSTLGGKLLVPAAIGTGVAALGGAFLPGLAGSLAAGVSGGVGGAGRNLLGAGNTLLPGPGGAPSGVYPFEQNAIPQNADPTFGYGSPYGTMADIKNPLGRFAASQEAEKIAFDTQMRNMQLQAAKMTPWIEGAKKAELARNLYAATVRNNLATQQQLLLGGVANARAMGLNAANTVGNAIASQYQYS